MIEYKNYSIFTEHGHESMMVTAIPDEGETIRRRFVFHSEAEALEITKEFIDQKGEGS